MAALSSNTHDVWLNMSTYPPHFVQDHVVAVCLWVALYMVESAGILSLWVDDHNDQQSTTAMSWVAVFSKVLVPLNLTIFKALWLKNPYFKGVQTAVQAGNLRRAGLATAESAGMTSTYTSWFIQRLQHSQNSSLQHVELRALITSSTPPSWNA
jgi:hypothetical protein